VKEQGPAIIDRENGWARCMIAAFVVALLTGAMFAKHFATGLVLAAS
jgi:hypothetical protein